METRNAFKCFLLHQVECQLLLFITDLKGRENREDKISLSFSNEMSHHFQTSIHQWVRGGEKRKLLGSLPPPEPQKARNPRCWLDFPIFSHTHTRHFDQKLGVTLKVVFLRSFTELPSKHSGMAHVHLEYRDELNGPFWGVHIQAGKADRKTNNCSATHTRLALLRDATAATQVQRRETQQAEVVVGMGSCKHTSLTFNTWAESNGQQKLGYSQVMAGEGSHSV